MVGTRGFCLSSREFVGLLKRIFFLVIFFPSCSDVFERMYVCMHMCVKSGVFLDCCPPCMHSWVYVCVHEVLCLLGSLPPEFADGVCLLSQLALGIPCLCFPSSGIISGLLLPPSIYMGSGNPNSGPRVCTPNT